MPIGQTLRRIADVSVVALTGAEFAGIAMLEANEHPTTAVFTDEEAPEIDQAQYDTGRGPCLEAWRTRHRVRLDDLGRADDGYTEFAEACMHHGIIHSTLSMPLRRWLTSRAAVSELDEVASVYPSPALVAAAVCSRAAVELVEEEVEDAVRLLHHGLQLWRDASAPYDAAKALLLLASAMSLAGDTRSAMREVRAARSCFDSLGARLDAERRRPSRPSSSLRCRRVERV